MVESTVAPEMSVILLSCFNNYFKKINLFSICILLQEEIPSMPNILSLPEESVPISLPTHRQNDIMEVLLAHEKKGGQSAPIIPGAHSEESNTSDSENDASKSLVGVAGNSRNL